MFIQPLKIIILSLALVTNAYAHDEAACKGDIEKFCKGVEPGKGHLMKCLKGHDNMLSQGCKDSAAKMKEKMHAFKDACKADKEKFCKDVKQGKGRIIACLKGAEANLSAGCKDAMTHHHDHDESED